MQILKENDKQQPPSIFENYYPCINAFFPIPGTTHGQALFHVASRYMLWACVSQKHWATWKNRSDLILRPNGLSDWQITRSDQSSDQNTGQTTLQNLPWSALHFCLQLANMSTYLWPSIINDATDEYCICSVYLCQRYFEHLMRMFTFL